MNGILLFSNISLNMLWLMLCGLFLCSEDTLKMYFRAFLNFTKLYMCNLKRCFFLFATFVSYMTHKWFFYVIHELLLLLWHFRLHIMKRNNAVLTWMPSVSSLMTNTLCQRVVPTVLFVYGNYLPLVLPNFYVKLPMTSYLLTLVFLDEENKLVLCNLYLLLVSHSLASHHFIVLLKMHQIK